MKRWQTNFAEQRLAGISKDAPRGGRKPKARDRLASAIVRKTTQEKPKNATHWSTRTLARELGASHSMVHRVWKAAGLKPHRVKTFKLIRRDTFTSVKDLVEAIMSYINEHNTNPKSLAWTAKAEDILAKVECARAVLHNVASA